jgi:VWFA-related protein
MKPGTLAIVIAALMALAVAGYGQKPSERQGQNVRTVTIPISIFTKKELRQDQMEEFIHIDRLIVKEDKDEQTILSVRSVASAPLSLAILLQEDLTSDINLQLKDLHRFIETLPRGSRVMVGFIRGGTLRVKQRFTDNLERASAALQIVAGTAAANGPFEGVETATNYFESLPTGRHAILLVSDGVDASRGNSPSDLISTPEMERAILKAQRRGIAIYSIWSPRQSTQNPSDPLISYGQSALARLSDETGGRAFYQGSIAPVSFTPFLKDLSILFERQFALTYLSTHMKKGYHRVEVSSTNPDVRVEHPKGYYYR